MTSEISAVSHEPSCKPAIRLSLSNLATLLDLCTEPGSRRGGLTLRDGTVVEVIPDAERYGAGPLPALEPSARACKDAIERLARTRREQADARARAETNRELDRAFEAVQVASRTSLPVQK